MFEFEIVVRVRCGKLHSDVMSKYTVLAMALCWRWINRRCVCIGARLNLKLLSCLKQYDELVHDTLMCCSTIHYYNGDNGCALLLNVFNGFVLTLDGQQVRSH